MEHREKEVKEKRKKRKDDGEVIERNKEKRRREIAGIKGYGA
jgi:hypothetical protein